MCRAPSPERSGCQQPASLVEKHVGDTVRQCIDWSGAAPRHVQEEMQFARWLIETIGVNCIPASPFYQEADKKLGQYFARFAVCKKDETLDAAAERFAKLGKT